MNKNTFLIVAALGVLAFNNLSAQTLEAHFKFDNNLTDETGNYTLNSTNNPEFTYVTGADGTAKGAVTGIGVLEYFETNENFGITGNASRTVTSWIKTSKNTNGKKTQRGIVQWGKLAPQRSFTLMAIGVKVRTDITNGGGTAPTPAINNGNWHHLAVVFDGVPNTSKIYIDGKLQLTKNWGPTTLKTTAAPLLIGIDKKNDEPRGFEGAIDDVRVYRGALTQPQITALYDVGDSKIE